MLLCRLEGIMRWSLALGLVLLGIVVVWVGVWLVRAWQARQHALTASAVGT